MGLISSLNKAFSTPYTTVSVAEAKELLSSGAALINASGLEEVIQAVKDLNLHKFRIDAAPQQP